MVVVEFVETDEEFDTVESEVVVGIFEGVFVELEVVDAVEWDCKLCVVLDASMDTGILDEELEALDVDEGDSVVLDTNE